MINEEYDKDNDIKFPGVNIKNMMLKLVYIKEEIVLVYLVLLV